MEYRLGKKPATPDTRDLKFAAFADLTALPTPPARFGHGNLFHAEWHMLGNDRYGDCVWAGAAHETMLWNRLVGHNIVFDDVSVLADYSAVTGFSPANPATDQGTDVREALGYRQKTGVADKTGKRHQIGAYVALDAKDWDQLMQAVYVFGVVGIGFEFPDSAMEQFNAGLGWDVVAGATIEGGHYVPVVGRLGHDNGGCITWGKRQGITCRFYETYNDEAWALASLEELRAGRNERGFDFAGLQQALNQIRGG